MTTPSVILRSLKNEGSGIDIAVPCFKEEEAPLGGVSILYEVSVITRLQIFKNSLHKPEDIVQFTLHKAYRELEDFHSKIKKKYPAFPLPPIPKSSEKQDPQEKTEALHDFMSAIAQNAEIVESSIFIQFIGICPLQMQAFKTDETAASVETNDDSSKIFQKVKNGIPAKAKSAGPAKNNVFEGTKYGNVSKGPQKPDQMSPQGLFDDELEDDDLFSSKPMRKTNPDKPNDPVAVTSKPAPLRKQEKAPVPDVDDSEIIIKDRKAGDLSLFSEQDFGDYVTKEEELLFMVTSPETVTAKNLILENEILSPDTDDSVCENLDELLAMDPLPDAHAGTASPMADAVSEVPPVERASAPEPSEEAGKTSPPAKPVPLPRKKSLGKTETDALQKPQVMPRKVFLTKPDTPPKPSGQPPPIAAKPSSAKPAVPLKPALAPKPKPPPKKPKPVANSDAVNANTDPKVPDLNNDLNELDILKYIEQEQKSVDSELSLFD